MYGVGLMLGHRHGSERLRQHHCILTKPQEHSRSWLGGWPKAGLPGWMLGPKEPTSNIPCPIATPH